MTDQAHDPASIFRLDGRIAVVVGTSPNIGTGIAVELGRAGARVACVDANETYASKAAEEVRNVGAEATPYTADVTDENMVNEVFADIESDLGLVTVLVNAPVWYNVKGLLAMPFGEWKRQTSIILDGAFLCTRAVVRRLVDSESTGSIINLTSTAAYQGEPGNVGYSTAKSGIINFTRSVAMEFADRGIRVNSLSPTATGMSEALERAGRWGIDIEIDQEWFAEIARRTPMGALPLPSNYGHAAVFLASDASSMMTGSEIRVDAGTVARYWRWDPAEARR